MPGIVELPQLVLHAGAVQRTVGTLCREQKHFTFTCHIPNVNHKVRIVLIWDQRRNSAPKKALVTNRVRWEMLRES